MATHSSILAWRISRTEEPGGLQSIEARTHLCLNLNFITNYLGGPKQSLHLSDHQLFSMKERKDALTAGPQI